MGKSNLKIYFGHSFYLFLYICMFTNTWASFRRFEIIVYIFFFCVFYAGFLETPSIINIVWYWRIYRNPTLDYVELFFTPQRASALLCFNFNQELIDTVMQFFLCLTLVILSVFFFLVCYNLNVIYYKKKNTFHCRNGWNIAKNLL